MKAEVGDVTARVHAESWTVVLNVSGAAVYLDVDDAQRLSNELQDAVDELGGMGQS